MKKTKGIVAITGASGIIGKNIIQALKICGYDIRVLSRNESPNEKGIELVVGDLSSKESLSIFLANVDYLFHCAGEKNRPELMFKVNIEGTQNLFDIATTSGLKYFCHISSAGVVGKTHQKWVTEDSSCNPQNEYERTKFEAEKIVCQKIPNCSTVILRPINVIDNQNPGVYSLPIRNSLKDKLQIVAKGAECAHLVHASHVAECAVFFMDRVLEYSEVFFVGMDEDDSNTLKGVWNSFHSRTGNQKSIIRWNMPVWFPFLIRKCIGVSSNFGHIRYSSNKLRAYGFDNKWEINRVTGIMVENYCRFMKAQNVN